MAAALYPAAVARYTATAYGWAEEAGADVAALAQEARVVPATRGERWGDG